MNKLTNLVGIVGLSLASLVSGCSILNKRNIEVVAKADFNKDGSEEFVGYFAPDFFNATNRGDLIMISSKNVGNDDGNYFLYPKDEQYALVQLRAKMFGQYLVANVSTEDVNKDGWPDLSYDRTRGLKKHKVYLNQRNGCLKGEI